MKFDNTFFIPHSGIMAYTAKHRLNEPTIVGQSLEGATRGDFSAYADGVAKEDDDDTKDAQNDMVVDDMKPEAAEEPLVDRKGKGKASVSDVPAAPLIDAAEDDSDDEDEDETYRPPASDDDDSEVGEEFDSEYESGSEAGGGSEADSGSGSDADETVSEEDEDEDEEDE